MSETLLHTFLERAAAHGDRPALCELQAGGAPADAQYSWSEWADRARSLARALRGHGCRPGDHVAVLAGNSVVWPIAELGTLMAGAIPVGVYPTSAPVQVQSILNDCAAVAVVADTREQLAKVLEVRSALPALRAVVCAEASPDAELLADWLREPALEAIHEPAEADDAILIYTSGSTGEPKGARISHRYLKASAASIQQVLGLTEADSSLSFLPFCHAAERIFGLYTRIHTGMSCGLVADHRKIWEAARAFEPTLFGGLPRFYEKLYETLHSEYGGVTEANLGQVQERIAQFTGTRVRCATSGGATLPLAVVRYLSACGLEVLGAYGLTEHLCAAMHRPGGAPAYDAVGAAMPGTEIRISDSGEILLRKSALTFSGYYNRPADTAAAFTADGEWLRTGDTGRVDDAGLLYVTGRQKELIALSTGKKVAPLPIEARLISHPLIAQAVLVGENRKYVAALIAVRPAVVQAWAREHGIRAGDGGLWRHPALREALQREIDRVNADLSRSEQIRRFAVLPAELSVEKDELTPTMKVRRSVVYERYQLELESLYSVTA
jgi:long-chain acyl-CoA synthetase